MNTKNIAGEIGGILGIAILCMIAALVVFQIGSSDIFTSVTIFNVTVWMGYFGAFLLGIGGLFSLVGLLYGLALAVPAIKWIIGAFTGKGDDAITA